MFILQSIMSIFIPLYERTIQILEKEDISPAEKAELYAIVKYIENVYELNKQSAYVHKIIQLVNCAFR